MTGRPALASAYFSPAACFDCSERFNWSFTWLRKAEYLQL
jgi:hypothetical protein